MVRSLVASVAIVWALTACATHPDRAEVPASSAIDAPDRGSLPFRAEILPSGAIVAQRAPGRPLHTGAFRLTRADGSEIGVAQILPRTAEDVLIIPSEDLDITRVHHLDAGGERTRVRFDGWFRDLYSHKSLGAEVVDRGAATTFRIFAPRATGVRLHLYETADAEPEAAYETVALIKDSDGVWEAERPGDLHGAWYDFTIRGPADPGNRYYETDPVHISDPYARVYDEATGKARVWRPTAPARPLRGGRPAMEDVVAYEVHVQDFTDRLPVDASERGTLPAMARMGLTNGAGEAVGFDHLVELGINVVHLMPVQEYLHHPDADWRARFGDDPAANGQGVGDENYQWGYRTTHAFAIEGKFRSKESEPGAERDQFRDLVQAFHDRGIAVIVDLAPNHTGENMDGRERLLNFNVLDKAYYYRTDDDVAHIGPFGNEVKTEDRPMVQRWLIDQCLSLVGEFGIDGFRIDLAGQIDEQTLVKLRAALPDDIILYGEPWIDVSDPVVAANPDWDWYKEDAPITFFQDETRNAFAGSPFRLEDKAVDRGYAGGNAGQRAEVMAAIANNFAEEAGDTRRGINYLDIHDNWTLADRFATSSWNGLNGVDEAEYRIAAGLLLTSLGPVVIHGGSEMLRSKGLAPIGESVVETDFAEIHFKGRDDTYNLRAPNQFVWDDLGGAEPGRDVAAMEAWWKGLIALRLSPRGAVFRVVSPADDHVRFFTPEDERLLAYLVGGDVLVAVNMGEDDGEIRVDLPDGDWRLVADGARIDPDGLDGALKPGAQTVSAPATTFQVWARF